MNREIPGFYYDSAKRKYFRIEDSRTAPAEAAWSSRNVKRRAVEQKEDEERRERVRRAAGRVKRARVRSVPLLGGLLAREAGEEVGAGAFMLPAGEEVVRAWAGGLKGKGSVKLWPWLGERADTIPSLWVGGDSELSGLGVMFAAAAGTCMAGSWVPRDADDNINFGSVREPVVLEPRYLAENVTAVKFHDPSSSLLMACVRQGTISVKRYAPSWADAGYSSPAFLLERGPPLIEFDSILNPNNASTIHALQPAWRGSRLTCIAGTDHGILQLRENKLEWLTPPPPPIRRRRNHPDNTSRLPWQGDILSVDFAHHNPTEVILAGTRSGHVCLLDMRVPPSEWTPGSNTFHHVSSVGHVRSVGPYEVLAAGPRSAMALYDIRFLQQQQQQQQQTRQSTTRQRNNKGSAVHQWRGNATRPIVEFPAYRNEAHVHTGLDVLTEPGYGSRGIVAAAHDDETVALYSLRDGTRIPGGAVDGIKAGAVVMAMMWATLPGDRHPSLFVGEGTAVKKYSFWA